MKRKLFPAFSFFIVFLLHAGYVMQKIARVSAQWAQVEKPSALSLYIQRQYIFTGFSYALAAAFTCYAFLKFLENRRRDAKAFVFGGITFTGLVYAGGCFLTGCCGSPMLGVYMGLFGSSYLGVTKPLVALITFLSVIGGVLWMERKNKSCCEPHETAITSKLSRKVKMKAQKQNTQPNALYKKGLYLEYFTVVYNILEAVAAILFGTLANSIALVGFGLDSIVESLSGCVLIWRLRASLYHNVSEEEEEEIEKRAMKFVAITFFILAVYVGFQSVKKIILKEMPDPSLPGIIIAALSLIVMPVLTFLKYKTGKQLNSRALIADSKETLACSFLSVALLLGLGCHYVWGFWQTDPIVGFIIVLFLFREGLEGWKEAHEENEAK